MTLRQRGIHHSQGLVLLYYNPEYEPMFPNSTIHAFHYVHKTIWAFIAVIINIFTRHANTSQEIIASFLSHQKHCHSVIGYHITKLHQSFPLDNEKIHAFGFKRSQRPPLSTCHSPVSAAGPAVVLSTGQCPVNSVEALVTSACGTIM